MLKDSAKLNIDLQYSDNTHDTLDAHYVIGFASAAAVFTVGTHDVRIAESFALFPNPSTDKIYLEVKNDLWLKGEVEVKIISMLGQQFTKKTVLTGNRLEVDVSGLVTGPYVVVVSDGEKQGLARFMKE